ncbi:MAG: hypothetical protein ACP5HW_03120 [Candidatus Micrarchaeia archaeon]
MFDEAEIIFWSFVAYSLLTSAYFAHKEHEELKSLYREHDFTEVYKAIEEREETKK